MAGHNKWSKIKHTKAVEDKKRSKMFSKMIKEIMVSVKEGGADPEANPRLRTAIANAKGVNMPKKNIESAIKKASEGGVGEYMDLNYEGYAPGGVAVFIECSTDNQNRAVSNVRAVFNKYNGNLATKGSVDFMFAQKGVFVFEQGDWNHPEDLELELIDAGAEEVDLDDGLYTVTTDVQDFGNMQKKLEELGIEPKSASLQRIPQNTQEVDLETARKVLKVIDALEDEEDVKAVYHNMEMTDEIVAEVV